MTSPTPKVDAKISTIELPDDDLDNVISQAEQQLKNTAEKIIKNSAEASKFGVQASVATAPVVGTLLKEVVGAINPVLKPLTDIAVDSSVDSTAKAASERLPVLIDNSANKSVNSTNKVIHKAVSSTK